MASRNEKVQEFWNARSKEGQNAGTNDFMLKYLEEDVLIKHIPSGSEVLDIGCGNGSTLIRLIKEKGCAGVGLDYADNLLELANKNAIENGVQDKVRFMKQDVLKLSSDIGLFQHIFTQRCLINLGTKNEQEQAFASIVKLLPSGAFYYMIEAFNDGNRALNELRESLNLPLMTSPWHNRFFELNDVLRWGKNYPVKVQQVSHFASTYYYLSRVVYAKLASDRGEELRYDSDINKVSLLLPPMGEFGATKLIVWQKI
jgi:cyclopropane fatty-acyl-phospholipid synthase-like methyltransferase